MHQTMISSKQQSQELPQQSQSPRRQMKCQLQRIPRSFRRSSLPNQRELLLLNRSNSSSSSSSSSRSLNCRKPQRRQSYGDPTATGDNVVVAIQIPPLRRRIRRFSFPTATCSHNGAALHVYVDPTAEKPGLRRMRRNKTHDGIHISMNMDTPCSRWSYHTNSATSTCSTSSTTTASSSSSSRPDLLVLDGPSNHYDNPNPMQNRHPSLPDLIKGNKHKPEPPRMPRRPCSVGDFTQLKKSLGNATFPKRSNSGQEPIQQLSSALNATFPKRSSSNASEVVALASAAKNATFPRRSNSGGRDTLQTLSAAAEAAAAAAIQKKEQAWLLPTPTHTQHQHHHHHHHQDSSTESKNKVSCPKAA